MAEELADARLLTHDAVGHTALFNPSSCVQAYESRYFIDGTLPPSGATCRQDTPPSLPPSPAAASEPAGVGWPAPSPERAMVSGLAGRRGLTSVECRRP